MPTKQPRSSSRYGFQSLCFALGITVFLVLAVGGVVRALVTEQSFPDVDFDYTARYGKLAYENDSPEFISALRTAATIDIDNPATLRSLLIASHRHGDSVNALFALKNLVRLFPRNANLRSDLTMAYLDVGDAKAAVVHGRIAAGLDAESPKALSAFGAALLGSGEKSEAAAVYRNVLEIVPTHKAAQEALKYPLQGW